MFIQLEIDWTNSGLIQVTENVIYVDFKTLSKPSVSSGCELIEVDFINKKRAA